MENTSTVDIWVNRAHIPEVHGKGSSLYDDPCYGCPGWHDDM